jgi:hypothetical protein
VAALYKTHALGLTMLAHVMLGDKASAEDVVSPATLMGPLSGVFCHEHGTTRLPVMGPPGVSR